MLSIAPLTESDLTGKVQISTRKLEVQGDSGWVDLTSRLKRVAYSASVLGTKPVSPAWSADLENIDGQLHPLHPTSGYADLLQIGRRVRLFWGIKTTTAFSFREGAWAGWQEYGRIYIKNPKGVAVSNAPVCVRIDADTAIGALCRADGYDVRFADSDGTELAQYRKSFSVSGGAATGEFWVKIPTLPAAGKTIYCTYGNPDATNVSNPNINPNILTNSDFEQWNSPTDLVDWVESRPGSSTINQESTEKTRGNYAVRLDIDSSNSYVDIYHSDLLSKIGTGKKFKISLKAKSNVSGKELRIVLRANVGGTSYYYNFASDVWTTSFVYFLMSLTTAYQKFLEYFNGTLPSGTTSLQILIARGFAASSSSLYFDDLVFLRADSYDACDIADESWYDQSNVVNWLSGRYSTDYLWQRVIGFLDEPRFNQTDRSVSLSGMDYNKVLADKKLYEPYTSWGDVAVFDSIASPGVTGAEQYQDSDAVRIGLGETNSVGEWTNTTTTRWSMSSVAGGNGSNYSLKFVTISSGYFLANMAENVGPVSLIGGREYVFGFDFKVVKGSGDYIGKVMFYNATTGALIGEQEVALYSAVSGIWQSYQKKLLVQSSGLLKIVLYIYGITQYTGTEFYLDNVSVKFYDNTSWTRYLMPEDCQGVYYVTLNGEPVWQGDEDGKGGWHYDDTTKSFYFSENMGVPAGTQNLYIYYYKSTNLDNVVADLLVAAGLYASRSAALAAMDYTPTGVTVDKVYFNTGVSVLQAIETICERVNYRFYFKPDGTPVFGPKPTLKSTPDWTFTPDEMTELNVYQNSSTVFNHVIIEGCERSVLDVSTQTVKKSTWKGEAKDDDSIAIHQHKTLNVRNHLFQDQDSVDGMAATLVAEMAWPRLYIEFTSPFYPVPLEIGDTVRVYVPISTDLAVPKDGLITSIAIDDDTFRYTVEVIVPVVYKLMVDEVGIDVSVEEVLVAVAGSVINPAEMAVGVSIESTSLALVYTFTSALSNYEFTVPSGVSTCVIECWGTGGAGGNGGTSRGGGGGGGAYSKKTISVSGGDKLYLTLPSYATGQTKVVKGGTTQCAAEPGVDGDELMAGGGGVASNGVGDVRYSGGNGYIYATGYVGGGGGGSAGPSSNGNNATSQTGATAVSGGGPGGMGGLRYYDGDSPVSGPGGGGGGGGQNGIGAPGAIGKIVLTFY